jgi:hypothetical protein
MKVFCYGTLENGIVYEVLNSFFMDCPFGESEGSWASHLVSNPLDFLFISLSPEASEWLTNGRLKSEKLISSKQRRVSL